MRTIQQDVMTTKDTRIKRTTETLTGIRAVKFYVWEDAQNDVISDIRKTELHHLRRIQMLNVNLSCFNESFRFGIVSS